MLRYFLQQKDIQQVTAICEILSELKHNIDKGKYGDAIIKYNECINLFDQVKEIAILRNDERFANAQFVFRQYFMLFCNLAAYFELLQEGRFKDSWGKLQDCLDDIKYVGRFANDRLDIPDICDLLISYEKLYPYTIFTSSEYVITRSHCSICGESMQRLACSHIIGNLYWGEPAIEIIDEIKGFQAVSVVSHPKDKRCVIELSDDDRTEMEKFYKLFQFLELRMPLLQNFSIKTIRETRKKENLPHVERNDPCPCGSGKKYKRCCGKDLYYQCTKDLITPQNRVKFFYT